jgi:hypothetical protein
VLTGLFLAPDTNAAIRGTHWAGYQAITEHLDHAAPVHGTPAGDKAVNRDLASPAIAPSPQTTVMWYPSTGGVSAATSGMIRQFSSPTWLPISSSRKRLWLQIRSICSSAIQVIKPASSRGVRDVPLGRWRYGCVVLATGSYLGLAPFLLGRHRVDAASPVPFRPRPRRAILPLTSETQ